MTVGAVAVAFGCAGEREERKATGNKQEATPVAPESPPLEVSKPTPETLAVLAELEGDFEVLSFLPPGDVADQVAGYFGELAQRSEREISLRELDRFLDVEAARRHRVSREGTVVLVRDDLSEKIVLKSDRRKAEQRLRQLDAKVAGALADLKEPPSAIWLDKDGGGTASAKLRRLFEALDFRWSRLDPADSDLPSPPALLVYAEGISTAERGVALNFVDRHLGAGGAALLFVEPGPDASLGPVGKRLGVTLNKSVLADAEEHLVRERNKADRTNLATNNFKAHAASSTAVRHSARGAMVFLGSGSFELKPDSQASVLVESMASSFRDRNGNLEKDGGEPSGPFPIAIAAGDEGMRAVLYADADWLEVLRQVPVAAALFADAAQWLGRSEELEVMESGPPGEVELTSYPRRPRPPKAGDPDPIWTESRSAIERVRYRDGKKAIRLARDAAGRWSGEVTRHGKTSDSTPAEPRRRRFPADPEGLAELTAALAAPVPIRALGEVDEKKWKAFGLASDRRLVVDFGASEQILVVGERVYGGAHRYVGSTERKEVWVLPRETWRHLDGGEAALRVRDAIGANLDEIERIRIEIGDESTELERSGGRWSRAGGAGQIASLLVELLPRVRPVEYEPAREGEVVATLRFFAGGEEEATLKLHADRREKPGRETYWISSERTGAMMGRIRRAIGKRLASAIDQISK